MGAKGRMYASFNQILKIACIDTRTGMLLFKGSTHLQPRTIALSKNNEFLFVTCYEGNAVDVFEINSVGFSRVYTIKCDGKPVGNSLYEDRNYLEAWQCNYMAGNLKILRFKKGFE